MGNWKNHAQKLRSQGATFKTAALTIGAVLVVLAGMVHFSQGVFEKLAGIQATRAAQSYGISLSERKKGLLKLLSGQTPATCRRR